MQVARRIDDHRGDPTSPGQRSDGSRPMARPRAAHARAFLCSWPALTPLIIILGCGNESQAVTTAADGAVAGRDGNTASRDSSAEDGGAFRDGDSRWQAPCRPLASAAVPIVPCLSGYGVGTPAGSGRHRSPPATAIMRVTQLGPSGDGSLRACMEASGARTCLFEVSGTIVVDTDIEVRDPYLTVAGETAPPPGVAIQGGGIHIAASHVWLSHLRVRVGDDFPGPAVNSRDAIRISNSSAAPDGVVIDHCSLAFSSDETASIWNDAGDVTFADTIFGPPLHDSVHIDEGATEPAPHGYGPIFGEFSGRVSVQRSLFLHQYSRNPLSRIEQLSLLNNLIYDWGTEATTLSAGRGTTKDAIIGNQYLRGPNSLTRAPIIVQNLNEGSLVFFDDNRVDGALDDALYDNRGQAEAIASSDPTDDVGIAAAASATLLDEVLPAVGARPDYRDALDARAIEDVRARAGAIINCVEPDGSPRCEANGGGYPALEENRRALSLPARPFDDDDGDGYTNLENFIHGFRP